MTALVAFWSWMRHPLPAARTWWLVYTYTFGWMIGAWHPLLHTEYLPPVAVFATIPLGFLAWKHRPRRSTA